MSSILKNNPYIKRKVQAQKVEEYPVVDIPFKKNESPRFLEAKSIVISEYLTDEGQESFIISIDKSEIEEFNLDFEQFLGLAISKVTKKIGLRFLFRDKVAREEQEFILIDKNIQLSERIESLCQVELETLFLVLSKGEQYLFDENGEMYSTFIVDRKVYKK